MLVDIYVREKNGIREIRIPILPEEIPSEGGDATNVTFSIMNLGDVAIPSGTELEGWSWKSEFPGFGREHDPLIRGTWYQPREYDSILKDWKKNRTELTLLCIGYPINADVYLTKYHPTAAGPFGDINYEIGFVEARQIVVTSSTASTTSTATTTRPTSTSSTYTIKKGDTLWAISKKFYGDGTKWKTIYNANKDIIESTAKKYGKKSSDNGHWIYPGVAITIPGVGGSGSSNTGKTPSSTKTPTAATEKTEKAKAEAYTSKRNQSIDDAVKRLT